MICLRCGYCCQNYHVVLPDGSLHEGLGKDCKYLTWDEDGKAVCTIHGRIARLVIEGVMHEIPWDETPCGQYSQIEKGNTPCRMGEYVLERRAEAPGRRGR